MPARADYGSPLQRELQDLGLSTHGSDFPFDFELALTEERAQQIPEVKEMLDNPLDWLQDWSRQVGAELKDGVRENPSSWIAFVRENGSVYHTYTVSAPDPFVAPYHSFLLDRTPKGPPDEPRAWRKDEYPAYAQPVPALITRGRGFKSGQPLNSGRRTAQPAEGSVRRECR
jgi:Bacterial protein of unknown function (DUF899)